jgi:hypothetical protein
MFDGRMLAVGLTATEADLMHVTGWTTMSTFALCLACGPGQADDANRAQGLFFPVTMLEPQVLKLSLHYMLRALDLC